MLTSRPCMKFAEAPPTSETPPLLFIVYGCLSGLGCSEMPKLGKGSAITSQTQLVVTNVNRYFEKEKLSERPSLPYSKTKERVADATNIGLKTVRRICREEEIALSRGMPFPLGTPGKKRPRASPVSLPDSFTMAAIRRRIHQFYVEGQLPTLRNLVTALSLSPVDDPDAEPIYNGSKDSLRILLTKHLGFKFKKVNNRRHLLERTDVIAARYAFLREIRKVDINKVYFLDETWVNKNHSVAKCWQSNDCIGVKAPIGKGERLILLHAGSSEGFVKDGLLLFQSKSGKADYHDDMNAECFTQWFKTQLLPNIPSHSVIVMDNASYHSVQLDKAPVSNSLKKDMQDWLTQKKVPFHVDMIKAELYEIIKLHKERTKKYVIDELAASSPYFHRIIRLPPYHCHFNPIELTWSEIKQYVAKRNSNFTLSAVKQLATEAVSSITAESWRKNVHHVEKEIQESWNKDQLIEINIEPLIISVNQDSSSESESNSDSEDDFETSFQPLD